MWLWKLFHQPKLWIRMKHIHPNGREIVYWWVEK